MKKNAVRSSIISFCFASLAMMMALLLLAAVSFAQSTTDGAIGGVVTDPAGAVVPGANVTARNLGTSATTTATTDGSGRYLVSHLQPGLYSVEIAAKGFAGFKATNITVEVGRATPLDAALGLQAQIETVVATA